MSLIDQVRLSTPAFVVAAILLAGCGQSGLGSGAPSATREPPEQSFGPPYGPQPPAGRQVRIDGAELSTDMQTLTIGFVGGPPYLASDPCSTAYQPWLVERGEVMDVTVVQVEREHSPTLGQNQVCTSEGHFYTFRLALSSPFTGTTVNDLTGGSLFVASPPGVATANQMPAGWKLRRSFEQEPGPPPIWVEIYAPSEVAASGPYEGPGQLVLYQAFGLIGEWSDTRAEKARERGATPIVVSVNGTTQTLWQDGASGELDLSWTLGGDSFGLVGNTADMTADELVRIADTVTLTGN